ncbi:MAG: KpsF/GutQ family sugar-phosphate isomerase [Bacteroidales bacterium]|nr:KpsF/GutQ family sugar-phosphate isomerase [Bacteroidales bacterium]
MISVRSVAEKCLRDEAQAVLGVIDQLDEQFDRAIELIYQCTGKVVVTGVGKSGHIANKIAATLSSTGTPAFFMNPLDAFHGDLGMVADGDVVILISYSGQTDELLRLLPYFQHRGLPVISISGNRESLLAKNSTAHILVSVEREACPLNLAPTSSTTATLALGDAMACALIELRTFKANDFAQFHPGGSLGRRLLTTAGDVMRKDSLPVISPTMHLGDAILHVSDGKLGLCVIMEGREIKGIITDGDIRRAMQRIRERFFDTEVQEVMTKNPKCILPTMKIAEVQKMMHSHKIHAVLVVDEQQQLLGIVDSFSCEV